MSNEFDEVKFNNEKDEPVDIRQYPAFKSDESYNAFVRDLLEQDEKFRRGEIKGRDWEEVWKDLEEKMSNAEAQDNYTSDCGEGA